MSKDNPIVIVDDGKIDGNEGYYDKNYLKFLETLSSQTGVEGFDVVRAEQPGENLSETDSCEGETNGAGNGDYLSFTVFKLFDLKRATNSFSPKNIVSENGNEGENVVFKGHLPNHEWVAVKRFSKLCWPDSTLFAGEACAIGRLRSNRLANLIGYCCEGDERLLVAEYMPKKTLAKHLFLWHNHPIRWALRLKVAICVAEGLDYCRSEGFELFHDLNADRVLFDKDGFPRLSSFGFLKKRFNGGSYSDVSFSPPECNANGTVTPSGVVYSFGTILIDLLSGKHIPPCYALGLLWGKSSRNIIDRHLEGDISAKEATVVIGLLSQCLKLEASERPTMSEVVCTLGQLGTKYVELQFLQG